MSRIFIHPSATSPAHIRALQRSTGRIAVLSAGRAVLVSKPRPASSRPRVRIGRRPVTTTHFDGPGAA